MSDKVLDFVKKRKENIEEKRRNFERIMFDNVMGTYSVIDKEGSIYPVTLIDISNTGCLFEVPWNLENDEKFKKGTEIPMRMYFTKQSYIPVIVRIKYGKEFVDKDGQTYMRYGAKFDTTTASFDALKSFIDFLYKFAEHSTIDKGDAKVYFL